MALFAIISYNIKTIALLALANYKNIICGKIIYRLKEVIFNLKLKKTGQIIG